ncbi:hypothetical protein ACHAWC_002455, partial [Mediolabrus comicus]
MLLSGGVLDQESHDTTSDQAPFHIINWKLEADGTLLRPEMATYSFTGSEKIKDLGGTMVHHNLLKLPRSSNESILAALFGGGVPSFSFGQSFSKSFAVKITSASTKDNAQAIKKKQVSMETKENQINTRKNVTDVIYVLPRDAKATRIELERLRYFNGQHKLVKVEKEID